MDGNIIQKFRDGEIIVEETDQFDVSTWVAIYVESRLLHDYFNIQLFDQHNNQSFRVRKRFYYYMFQDMQMDWNGMYHSFKNH